MGHQEDDQDRTMSPNHDARKPLLFYKLMVASIVHDNKLKIPGKVVKRVERDLGIVVTVSVPDGKKWNVKLGKDEGKCWFGDGWVEFMKYYNVRVGYLLVFRYKGDSTFVVNIFNLGNAEIQYSPDPVGGFEKVRLEKQCLVSNGDRCGNGEARKKLDAVEVKEVEPYKKSGNESKELASAVVCEDKVCSETSGKESGDDGTQSYLAQQKVIDVASQSQMISTIINGLIQPKLNALRSEILSQIKNDKGGCGSEKVQLEKRCTLNKRVKFTSKRAVSGMTSRDKQCLVNKGKESGNNATHSELGSEIIKEEHLCSVTNQTEPRSNDIQEKSNLPPPGFGKPSHHGTDCILALQSDRGRSTLHGMEKELKPSGGAGSPSPFTLVKDVSVGKYRANIMESKKKKLPEMRTTKNPQPTNLGSGTGHGAVKVKINSIGKKEPTPEVYLSKMASNVQTVSNLTTAAKSEGSMTSLMRIILDGGHNKLPRPDNLYSETQLPKTTPNIPQATRQLNLHTPVKRKEINTTDILSKTAPNTVSDGHNVNVSTGDVLNCKSEKTAKVHKKQKTIQLSAISRPPINPFCLVPMRASYVQKNTTLNISTNFASKYLQAASGDATLQNAEGKQWKVRLSSSNGSCKISQGWHRFATDNFLNEFDMCIFELLDSVNKILKVSFIRSPKVPPPADLEVLKL